MKLDMLYNLHKDVHAKVFGLLLDFGLGEETEHNMLSFVRAPL